MTRSAQKHLPWSGLTEVNYVGNHGVHMLGRSNVNQPLVNNATTSASSRLQYASPSDATPFPGQGAANFLLPPFLCARQRKPFSTGKLFSMALRVNGELIGDERFYREFLAVSGGLTPEQMQQRSSADYQQAQEMAERSALRAVLLRQLARHEAIPVTEQEIEEERRSAWGSAANQFSGVGIDDEMAERAVVRKAERHITRHVPRPSRLEVEAIYRSNPANFTLPERWLVSHIILLAENEAERQAGRETLVRAEDDLKRGKPFAAVAERYSDCKGSGGALGWLARGQMVAEFEENVFTLRPKKPSSIFETPFGLHIALVQDHRPAGTQPLEEIRADLARRIYDDRRQRALDQALHAMFNGAQIELVSEPERSVASGEKVQ